jgi:hypothetical protein
MKLALGHMPLATHSGMNLSLTIGKKSMMECKKPALFFDGRNILNGQHCKRLVLCIKVSVRSNKAA